jgi:hypothetical protein
MKFDLNEQFTSDLRAELLLSKYSLPYIKEVINGLITEAKNKGEIKVLNYWNGVSIEIKKQIRYEKRNT